MWSIGVKIGNQFDKMRDITTKEGGKKIDGNGKKETDVTLPMEKNN